MRLPSVERERVVATVPWLLFVFLGAILFPVYDEFVSSVYLSYDDRSLSYVTQLTETGNPTSRVVIIALGLIGAWLLARNRHRIRLQPIIAKVLFAFLTWTAMSALWSTDPLVPSLPED
jgi:hypothetical protein